MPHCLSDNSKVGGNIIDNQGVCVESYWVRVSARIFFLNEDHSWCWNWPDLEFATQTIKNLWVTLVLHDAFSQRCACYSNFDISRKINCVVVSLCNMREIERISAFARMQSEDNLFAAIDFLECRRSSGSVVGGRNNSGAVADLMCHARI